MNIPPKTAEVLEGLGLSDNEAKVYISMLSLGSATVAAIAKAANVKRTTIYNVLDSLAEKGLSRIDVKGLKRLYVAEHPKKLENIIENRKANLAALYPELEALYNLKGGESFIKYYEGNDSVRNAYFDLLGSLQHNDEFLVVGNPDRWEEINASFASDFIKKRNTQKLQIRMLLTDSELARKYKKFERNFSEEIKLLPEDSKIETNLVITPRRILVQQMSRPVIVIVIENGSIIRMHRELFNIIWNSLKN
jgi:sugar-specific transcriptional regulator TrmB